MNNPARMDINFQLHEEKFKLFLLSILGFRDRFV